MIFADFTDLWGQVIVPENAKLEAERLTARGFTGTFMKYQFLIGLQQSKILNYLKAIIETSQFIENLGEGVLLWQRPSSMSSDANFSVQWVDGTGQLFPFDFKPRGGSHELGRILAYYKTNIIGQLLDGQILDNRNNPWRVVLTEKIAMKLHTITYHHYGKLTQVYVDGLVLTNHHEVFALECIDPGSFKKYDEQGAAGLLSNVALVGITMDLF